MRLLRRLFGRKKPIPRQVVPDLARMAANEEDIMLQAEWPIEPKLETAADRIVTIYASGVGDDLRRQYIEAIGRRIAHFDRQLLVAHRAIVLGALEGIAIPIRDLEYYWDGIGGWQR